MFGCFFISDVNRRVFNLVVQVVEAVESFITLTDLPERWRSEERSHPAALIRLKTLSHIPYNLSSSSKWPEILLRWIWTGSWSTLLCWSIWKHDLVFCIKCYAAQNALGLRVHNPFQLVCFILLRLRLMSAAVTRRRMIHLLVKTRLAVFGVCFSF